MENKRYVESVTVLVLGYMADPDYLPLESLLNLFARVLPTTNNSMSGRTQRTDFIRSVFKSTAPPEASSTAATICDILENVPTSNWEETSIKIISTLAEGNIA